MNKKFLFLLTCVVFVSQCSEKSVEAVQAESTKVVVTESKTEEVKKERFKKIFASCSEAFTKASKWAKENPWSTAGVVLTVAAITAALVYSSSQSNDDQDIEDQE